MGAEANAGDTSVDRAALAAEMVGVLANWGADTPDELQARITELLAAFSDAELRDHLASAAATGREWGYYPPDPVARRISRDVMGHVLCAGSRIENPEELEPARERGAVFLGNHLSYVDVNALDYLMQVAGYAGVADRITTLVGPKVFTHPLRRLASLCFGTIKLPQSTSRASGEAVMSAREVAKLARQTFRTASERRERGEHLLVFPEGSRSRTGRLQRCLAAVARYLEAEDGLIVPWGHRGCEELFPVGDERVHPATVRVRIGTPVRCADLFERCDRRRQLIADVVGVLIADLLPEGYRGVYGEDGEPLRRAREIADELR